MSERLVCHSQRYSGPAGDSRPAKEIFGGMESRSKQADEFAEKLTTTMNDVLENATEMSATARIELVKSVAFEWILDHDIEMREMVDQCALAAADAGKGE